MAGTEGFDTGRWQKLRWSFCLFFVRILLHTQTIENTLGEEGVFYWLGRRDSNPRMPGPKPGALPLGDVPIAVMTTD